MEKVILAPEWEAINQTIKNENRRSTAANTEKLLLDLYEVAILSPEWEDIDPTTRANMFNEVRAMINLKREIASKEVVADFVEN